MFSLPRRTQDDSQASEDDKAATNPIVSNKPLVKDEDGVDVHVYRSMISSMMYLTASRPDIMFAVCTCARFQVTPKASHLNAVKRIFSDYRGVSLDRKSITGGCQFLGRRLISWQCKKQTIVANSTTKAKYVATANCCGQGRHISRLRATYGVEFVSAASLVNTARPTLSTARLGKFGAVKQIWCCQENLVLLGKFGAARQTFVLQENLVLPGKFGAARQKFVLFFTVTTVAAQQLSEHFNDVYPTPAHNLKVFTNMSRKGLNFLGKITPLFPNMLTHAAKGEGSGEPTESQPTPSPTQPSTGDQPPKTSSSHATTQDTRDSLEGTNGNEGDQVQIPYDSPLSGGHTSDKAEGVLNLHELFVLCTNLSNRVLALKFIKDAQAAEISALKFRIKKLEKKCKPSISHDKAWLKSVKRLSMKKRFGKQESVSKQGRKKSKPKSTLDDSIVFDNQDHGIEYMETKEAMDEGRQSGEIEEVKLTDDTKEVSTARPDIDAARQEDSAVKPRTPPTTTSIFDDEDINMAQTLITIKEEKAKEKEVSIKDVDDSSRPARSILTLKPLPIIDPKDKGKSVLEEPEPAKKDD
ncbi:hypothetical protein Tco_0453280 [Tanacetum coccineum]